MGVASPAEAGLLQFGLQDEGPLSDIFLAGLQAGHDLCGFFVRSTDHDASRLEAAVLSHEDGRAPLHQLNGGSWHQDGHVDFIHLPVPRGRDDDAYFAPLKDLALTPGTELILGLVHHTDGVAGARRRIAAAEKVVSGFGIGTECGFGRRAESTIADLLRIHAEVADG